MMSNYQQYCLTRPIQSSIVMGAVFSGIDAVQYGIRNVTPKSVAMNMGFIYMYNAIQCPMAEIHGRESSLHNFVAAGTIGYLGVSSNRLGIPFIDPYSLYKFRPLTPGGVAFVVYGGIGFALATLGGKKP